MYSIIVAIADNNAIGKNNQLLWHLSDDLKYFKQITSGKTVIMGYNTWLSLPLKPLPHRQNIVLIDSEEKKDERFTPAYSLDDVHDFCNPQEECFIMGGGFVYRQFLPLAHRLYITHVLQSFEADTFFPEIDG
ncbi:MAG: dihydrofolate reductase, partial [Bacteroidales bacterium]|nr:dihydrofolate reductase [Bacteroidales bacterium]